jgi:hypothetical protein
VAEDVFPAIFRRSEPIAPRLTKPLYRSTCQDTTHGRSRYLELKATVSGTLSGSPSARARKQLSEIPTAATRASGVTLHAARKGLAAMSGRPGTNVGSRARSDRRWPRGDTRGGANERPGGTELPR